MTEQTQVMANTKKTLSSECAAIAAAPLTISPVGTKGSAEPTVADRASGRCARSSAATVRAGSHAVDAHRP